MPLIARANNGDFTPAPEGLWPGVCVDVVDKGMVQTKDYGAKHMIQIRWIIDADPPLPSGKPHMAVRSFGFSLSEKSHLRPLLEAWRGKKFTEEELEGFDLEKLIGVNGQVQILHNKNNGKVYANVQAVVPYPRGLKKMIVPNDYIRDCERERPEEVSNGSNGYAEPEHEYQPVNEDVPF